VALTLLGLKDLFKSTEILFFKKKITLYTTIIALTVSILTRYDMVKIVKTQS